MLTRLPKGRANIFAKPFTKPADFDFFPPPKRASFYSRNDTMQTRLMRLSKGWKFYVKMEKAPLQLRSVNRNRLTASPNVTSKGIHVMILEAFVKIMLNTL